MRKSNKNTNEQELCKPYIEEIFKKPSLRDIKEDMNKWKNIIWG